MNPYTFEYLYAMDRWGQIFYCQHYGAARTRLRKRYSALHSFMRKKILEQGDSKCLSDLLSAR
jgi:hypothetical protein